MVLSGSGEEEPGSRDFYLSLCSRLNIDRGTELDGWHMYERCLQQFTLEGDPVPWLVCALYVACRTSSVPSVGASATMVSGNGVSLTQLLNASNIGLTTFFNKMKVWIDMVSLPPKFRESVERIERNFNVTSFIFTKFKPIFLDIFRDPSKDPPRPKSRKHKRMLCSSAELFEFLWTMYIHVKSNFPAISDDLVNSYHLLLSCVDHLYANAVMADRMDLLNPSFIGLPKVIPPSEPPCLIGLLCSRHDGLVLEAKTIKQHWYQPYIRKLIDPKQILRGNSHDLTGLLDPNHFDLNCKSITATYELYVLSGGDFDERIFLNPNSSDVFSDGTSPSLGVIGADFALKLQQQRSLQPPASPEGRSSLVPATPLTAYSWLEANTDPSMTPVSTATMAVSKLQALLAGHQPAPGELLLDICKGCTPSPLVGITDRVRTMGDQFCAAYTQPLDSHPGSNHEFTRKRLQLAECLYYKTLDHILKREKDQVPANFDFGALLAQDVFHRSLFALCLEVVIFSYNSQRKFPWILETLNLESFYFYKVIEVMIRAVEGLFRSVVKHLKTIEESILESKAWRKESPLWDAITAHGGDVPKYEEVSVPPNVSIAGSRTSDMVSRLSNPIAHRFIALDSGGNPKFDLKASPTRASVVDRFNSPVLSSNARRRLFVGDNSSAKPTQLTMAMPVVVPASGKKPSTTKTIVLPGLNTQKSVAIPLQSPGGNSCIYIPVQAVAMASGSSGSAISGNPTNCIVFKPVGNAAKDGSVVLAPVESGAKLPRKSGSVVLFFRKFYQLVGIRLHDLCSRLDIRDPLIIQKMWTCLEHAIVDHTELMLDRNIDQLIMCSIYIVAKVLKMTLSFQDIMKTYRFQPHATGNVYRSVLLSTKPRRLSGNSSSDTSEESSTDGYVPGIRSSSTVPNEGVVVTGFPNEERGDIIKFYNLVFVKALQNTAVKLAPDVEAETMPLSPLPSVKGSGLTSPRRRISSSYSIFTAPLATTSSSESPRSPITLTYSFNRSPSKDLRAINSLIRDDRNPKKRSLPPDSDDDNSSNESDKQSTSHHEETVEFMSLEGRDSDVVMLSEQ